MSAARHPREAALLVPCALVLVLLLGAGVLARTSAASRPDGGGSVSAGDARCTDDPPVAPTGAGTVDPGGVTRVVAGSDPVTDAQGHTWTPSADLRGGQVVRRAAPVTGTASPDLYDAGREGVDRYVQDVPAPGTYAVEVGLAEQPGAAAGSRVFDVVANSQTVATNQDAVVAVGPGRPFHIHVAVPVTGRCLDLRFVPVVGQPLVSTVAVALLSPDLTERVRWSDEFTGPAGAPVDSRSWQAEVGDHGFGSNELQRYTDDSANAHLDGDGHLAIVARQDGRGGGGRARYTSARLVTKDKQSFTYGRIVARAQVPTGKGLWPGFWALGADIDTAGFPGSGEIDIMESDGSPGALLGHVHGPDTDVGTSSAGIGWNTGIVDRYAEYGVLWSPLAISFLLDGRPYLVVTPSDLPSTSAWVFDKPFYLLLSFAVGGNLPGPPDATTVFPAQLLVDYVRVYSW